MRRAPKESNSLISLILDFGRQIVSDVTGVVADFVLDDEGHVGRHGERHLRRERSRLAEKVEVPQGESQRDLRKEKVRKIIFATML